jgi:hypothetical protein
MSGNLTFPQWDELAPAVELVCSKCGVRIGEGDVRCHRGRDLICIDCHFSCIDCGKNTENSGELYIVPNELWASSGLDSTDGMLCLGCLERRIGRPLVPGDFELAPLPEAWDRYAARGKV